MHYTSTCIVIARLKIGKTKKGESELYDELSIYDITFFESITVRL